MTSPERGAAPLLDVGHLVRAWSVPPLDDDQGELCVVTSVPGPGQPQHGRIRARFLRETGTARPQRDLEWWVDRWEIPAPLSVSPGLLGGSAVFRNPDGSRCQYGADVVAFAPDESASGSYVLARLSPAPAPLDSRIDPDEPRLSTADGRVVAVDPSRIFACAPPQNTPTRGEHMDPDDTATDAATQTSLPDPYREVNPRLEVGSIVRVAHAHDVPSATGRLAELVTDHASVPRARFFEPTPNGRTGRDSMSTEGTRDRPVWFINGWHRAEPATCTDGAFRTSDGRMLAGDPVVARFGAVRERGFVSSSRTASGRPLIFRTAVGDGGVIVSSVADEVYPSMEPREWPPAPPGATSTETPREIADLLGMLVAAKDRRRRSGEWCAAADEHAARIFVHKAGESVNDLRRRIVDEVKESGRHTGEVREARAMLREVGLVTPGGHLILDRDSDLVSSESSSESSTESTATQTYSVGDRIVVGPGGLPGVPSSAGVAGIVREVIEGHGPIRTRYWVHLDGPAPMGSIATDATRHYGSANRPAWYGYAEDLRPGQSRPVVTLWENLRPFTADFRPRPGDRVRIEPIGIAGNLASADRDATVISEADNGLSVVEFDEATPNDVGDPTRRGDGGSADRSRWRVVWSTIRLVERPSEVRGRAPQLNDRVRVLAEGLEGVPAAAGKVASVVRVAAGDDQSLLLRFDEPVGRGSRTSIDDSGYSHWWATRGEVELYAGNTVTIRRPGVDSQPVWDDLAPDSGDDLRPGDRVRVSPQGLAHIRGSAGALATVISAGNLGGSVELEFPFPAPHDVLGGTHASLNGTPDRPRWYATRDQVRLVRRAEHQGQPGGELIVNEPAHPEDAASGPDLAWPTRPWARVLARRRDSGADFVWVLHPAVGTVPAAWVTRLSTRVADGAHARCLELLRVLYEGDEEPGPPRPALPTRTGAVVMAESPGDDSRRVAYVLHRDTPAAHAYTWEPLGDGRSMWANSEDLAGRVVEVLFEGVTGGDF